MLSSPAHDEVILAYHPLLGKKWAAFAATERGIEFAVFELPEKLPAEKELARLLLAPSFYDRSTDYEPFAAANWIDWLNA